MSPVVARHDKKRQFQKGGCNWTRTLASASEASRLSIDDAIKVKALAHPQPGRQLATRGGVANGGAHSHAVLDTSRGAMAEDLVDDVVLGQSWQAKMTCAAAELDESSGLLWHGRFAQHWL
jgi:hypothetical protein